MGPGVRRRRARRHRARGRSSAAGRSAARGPRRHTAPEADRDALRRTAAEAAAYADLLDQRVRDLTEADHVRAGWYVHTAETRAAADRARAELADRGIDPDAPADAVMVSDWLAGRDALVRAEDTYRPITSEADLLDTHADTDRVDAHADAATAAETGDPGHPRRRESRTHRRRCRRGTRPRRHRRPDGGRRRAGPARAT